MKLMMHNYESGILFGPWTPVYGVGVLVIVLIYKVLKKHIKKEWFIPSLLFVISAVIISLIEFLAGELIENVFNKVFWNYQTLKFNFGKYVSLEVAAIWGVLSLVVVYLFKKPIDKLIKHIPKWITYCLVGLFIIDGVLTLILK